MSGTVTSSGLDHRPAFAGVRAVVYPGTRMLPLAKNRLFLRFFVARALMR